MNRDPFGLSPDALAYVWSRIRTVPDFPKPGIQFKDITPLLGDPLAFHLVIDALAAELLSKGGIDLVAGIESRGFVFGGALALRLNAGFVPMRKPGKLPYDTRKETYDLEYGSASLEMHVDAVREGARVAVVDDLLATGGTARAAAKLVAAAGGQVRAFAFVVELGFLPGRDVLAKECPAASIAALLKA